MRHLKEEKERTVYLFCLPSCVSRVGEVTFFDIVEPIKFERLEEGASVATLRRQVTEDW